MADTVVRLPQPMGTSAGKARGPKPGAENTVGTTGKYRYGKAPWSFTRGVILWALLALSRARGMEVTRLFGMPVTRNVAWDGRLESFKGPDTAHYVLTAADLAKTCAACGESLNPGEPLSLLVSITQSTAPDGTEYFIFTDSVCHRGCSEPVLTIRRGPWHLEQLSPLAGRVILTQASSGAGRMRVVPVLAYTLVPVVTFREQGGERTSALVTLLLSHGFQLAMSPDYDEILNQAAPVAGDCSFTATPEGVVQFSIEEDLLYRDQLDLAPDNGHDAHWLQAARAAGYVLVIGGDNLDITEAVLDLHGAARQGTLAIGTVPFSEAR